jgi:hypothetical protein
MVSGLYWKLCIIELATVQYLRGVILAAVGGAGRGRGSEVLAPARVGNLHSCPTGRLLQLAQVPQQGRDAILNRIFSRVKPAQTQVFVWFSTLIFPF